MTPEQRELIADFAATCKRTSLNPLASETARSVNREYEAAFLAALKRIERLEGLLKREAFICEQIADRVRDVAATLRAEMGGRD